MKLNHFLDNTRRVDWLFLGITLALMTCGVCLVYSATASDNLPFYETLWFKQILYFAGGCVLAAGIVFLKIDWLKRATVPLYILSLVFLFVVLFVAGDVVKGAGRWIDLGLFKLQPSEFAKIAYLLTI